VIAIIGTVGIPANYGGFETLAENLASYNEDTGSKFDLAVYCSSSAFAERSEYFRGAALLYVGLDANGVQSIPYDMISLFDAVQRGHDQLLLLGVSGALMLPLLRLFTKVRIITNVDGVEWKREKWRGVAKFYLRFAERVAVKFSHEVIADNQAIADYLEKAYGRSAVVIPYGGDHAVSTELDPSAAVHLPDRYALGVCRIEPENNIAMILEAFDGLGLPLVFVGNWGKSAYGRDLRCKYAGHPSIIIHDPVYEARSLRAIRDKASFYLHGHSAGGTNPALVEMMHFGIPIAAYDCAFNRHTTEGKALYFGSAKELRMIARQLADDRGGRVGAAMLEIAQRRYTWSKIGQAYFDLLEK